MTNTQTANPEASDKKSIWDNNLPAGDSPPLPAWPLRLFIVAYCLWLVFLISMVILRLNYSG